LYLHIEGPFTHYISKQANPNRVVIDITGARLNPHLGPVAWTNGLIKEAHFGTRNTNTTRIVLDVSHTVKVVSSPWSQNGSLRGVRIDLVSTGTLFVPQVRVTKALRVPSKLEHVSPQSVGVNSRPVAPVQISRQNKPSSVRHQPPKSLRDVIVVLDAGHGGKDPGARGPSNSKEKEVVLAITLKLKQLIDKQLGMRAVLTRSGDYYIGLRERLASARKYNGDIFVSIHADGFNNPHSAGASVFALSQSGATSEAARWLAEKENYSELGGVNLGDLDDTNGVIRSVLIDLSQTATINASLDMGRRVLDQLHHFTRLHNQRVEQARFMVLKSPDIPSILVETGFISNPSEEKNLSSASYQVRLSQAIFEGVKEYFWNNPPPGTRLEAVLNNKIHLVRQGETLPAIARRYHVPVYQIQAKNKLALNAVLKPGQRLVIPT
jgi:N-acetylmuramoyl-L-alanine amidase